MNLTFALWDLLEVNRQLTAYETLLANGKYNNLLQDKNLRGKTIFDHEFDTHAGAATTYDASNIHKKNDTPANNADIIALIAAANSLSSPAFTYISVLNAPHSFLTTYLNSLGRRTLEQTKFNALRSAIAPITTNFKTDAEGAFGITWKDHNVPDATFDLLKNG